MGDSLEHLLIKRVGADPAFRQLVIDDPKAALKEIGVHHSDEFELEIIIQDPNTLYFLVPPLAESGDVKGALNMIDLWQSMDLFCWILPEASKLELLRMRRSVREAQER